MQLQSYTINRKVSVNEGIEERYQGYSSYFNLTVSDFTVIGYNADYKGNQLLLIFSLIALAIFVTIGTPLLIRANYKTVYTYAKEKDTNYIFVLWAIAVVGAVVVITLVAVDISILFIQRLSDGVPSVWQYYVGLGFIILFLIFDFILALSVTKTSDFPVPDVLRLLCFQTHHCCNGKTILPQTLAIWFTIMAAQLITFHAAFIFLALIASPVQTISTNLLYIAALFCSVSFITLFFASFRRKTIKDRNKLYYYFRHILYFVLFFCMLAFIILFATCFLRVTIYVGDVASGGLPSLFASLAPSAFLGALGFIAKRVLENYGTPKPDEESQDHSSGSRVALTMADEASKKNDVELARKRPVSQSPPPVQSSEI